MSKSSLVEGSWIFSRIDLWNGSRVDIVINLSKASEVEERGVFKHSNKVQCVQGHGKDYQS
jgi:hypothetical protein